MNAERDLALIERLDDLYSAVVADVLDRLGVRSNVMAPRIRPLDIITQARRLQCACAISG